MIRRQDRRQSGFTIVELLIATLVFSMVLIVITVGVLSFTRSYYKGVNQSNIQNTTRGIIESLAQQIQFSGALVTAPGMGGPNGSQSICIGDVHYSYVLAKQLLQSGTPSATQSRHVLVVKRGSICDTQPAQDLSITSPNGTELLQPGMRLTKFSVSRIGATNSYRVTIRVVYGDDDLLCSPAANDCQEGGPTTTGLNSPDLACKAGLVGGQYCAESELTTVVKQRLSH